MKLIIITGLSGSGKSVALNTLEDLGYNAMDNLPVFLLQELARRLLDDPIPTMQRTAVGIDARNASADLQELPALVKGLRNNGMDCQILFLDARDETLIKRFSETRRKHPLADRDHSLEEAMRLERQLLEPVLSSADLHIDTTHTNIHQLRDQVRARVEQSGNNMSILLTSFGFKHGVPPDVDFVFDVRCLPNPHWQPDLRPLTGRDRPVARFLESSPGVADMLADLSGFLERWIPAFEADARSYLTIGIGCTGGQHRSVYITEQLGKRLAKLEKAVLVRHRELP
jgi:UPF0042 nucleotide-binding protein